jgi:hypothetical protein
VCDIALIARVPIPTNARRCPLFQLSDCNDGGSALPQQRLHPVGQAALNFNAT